MGGEAASETSNEIAETVSSEAPSGEMAEPERRSSFWRWPSGSGKLPNYIHGYFRAKTFALLALQLGLVLCIMLSMELSGLPKLVDSGVVFFLLELVIMLALVALHWVRSSFPANYLLLGFVTIFVGLRWGKGSSFFGLLGSLLHFQVVGILCVTMGVAAVVSFARAHYSTNTWNSVVGSLFFGWACGCVVVAGASWNAGANILWVVAAIGITLALLGLLLCDVGRRLVLADPDDFMKIVVAMNSTLLVVVSIPVFAFGACVIHATDKAMERVAQAHQGRPAEAAGGAGAANV